MLSLSFSAIPWTHSVLLLVSCGSAREMHNTLSGVWLLG